MYQENRIFLILFAKNGCLVEPNFAKKVVKCMPDSIHFRLLDYCTIFIQCFLRTRRNHENFMIPIWGNLIEFIIFLLFSVRAVTLKYI